MPNWRVGYSDFNHLFNLVWWRMCMCWKREAIWNWHICKGSLVLPAQWQSRSLSLVQFPRFPMLAARTSPLMCWLILINSLHLIWRSHFLLKKKKKKDNNLAITPMLRALQRKPRPTQTNPVSQLVTVFPVVKAAVSLIFVPCHTAGRFSLPSSRWRAPTRPPAAAHPAPSTLPETPHPWTAATWQLPSRHPSRGTKTYAPSFLSQLSQ